MQRSLTVTYPRLPPTSLRLKCLLGFFGTEILVHTQKAAVNNHVYDTIGTNGFPITQGTHN